MAHIQQDDSAREPKSSLRGQERQSHYKFPQQQVSWLTVDHFQHQDTTSISGT